MTLPAVSFETFALVFEAARQASPRILEATSPATDVDMTVYVTDGTAGYAVRPDGELVLVFSTVPGRGAELVADAILDGADHLDCFDGYLPGFYAGHGFVETRREANWTVGGPDVVYMSLTA